MSAYRLTAVRFSYQEGGPEALAIPELEIPAGHITVLVGPNGSGKSTLLHLLAFLAEPTGGELCFQGNPVTAEQRNSLRLRVSLLLQNPYLFHTSVLENVEWGLKIRGVSASQRLGRAREALEQVGLSGYEDRDARALSGGEGQRLALARLLALEPDVLLLDEPTNHLDEETRGRVEEILERWVGERGTTVVMATHDDGQAYRLGSAVWRLERGRLSEGEPDNVFRGGMDGETPGVFVTGRLSLRVGSNVEGVQCIRIGPREIVLARETLPSSARNSFRGVVTRAELTGPEEVRVTLDCGESLVAVITRESWEELGLTVGASAVASFKASAVRPC